MKKKMMFRIILFLVGCMGSRLLLSYIAKNTKTKYLPYLGIITLIPVVGWSRIIFFKPRNTGVEVFGGVIWWQKIRPIHLMLYGIFSISAFFKKNYYQLLFLDTFIGFLAFAAYHLNFFKF